MKCPICHEEIPPSFCLHGVGGYYVAYHRHPNDTMVLDANYIAFLEPILKLNGHVFLDEERLERLLLLK